MDGEDFPPLKKKSLSQASFELSTFELWRITPNIQLPRQVEIGTISLRLTLDS